MGDVVPRMSSFRVRLDAIRAAVERVAGSDQASASSEIQQDLNTIDGATHELDKRIARMAAGNPDGWTAKQMRHDLRTPLNHIIGYGEMLLQEAEDLGASQLLPDLSRVVRTGRQILADIDELVKEVREPLSASTATPVGPLRARMPIPSVTTRNALTGHILIVDDHRANRDLLARHLEKVGHSYDEAADGVVALDKLEAGRFDLVLLDLKMPRMDGMEVLRWMKRDPVLQHVPVIVVSGHQDLPLTVECIQLGAEDYLSKPFDAVLLQARINACLQRKFLIDKQAEYVAQIEHERERANQLLRVILPEQIVQELQQTDDVKPRRHEGVAVLFCDIVGFTAYSERREPETILANLQQLVEAYEGLMTKHRMLKIKTIGDSFMAACGLLEPVGNPVLEACRCGRDMIAIAEGLDVDWGVRIGISYGPVVAGVLGRQQYQYDLWGDTVNTAARVEAHGQENRVCVSAEAWDQLALVPGAQAESLGWVKMKGKGEVRLFRLTSLP